MLFLISNQQSQSSKGIFTLLTLWTEIFALSASDIADVLCEFCIIYRSHLVQSLGSCQLPSFLIPLSLLTFMHTLGILFTTVPSLHVRSDHPVFPHKPSGISRAVFLDQMPLLLSKQQCQRTVKTENSARH